MEFIRQALLSAKILTPDGYISDALISNNACVCDRHGRVTHRIRHDAYGVDLIVTEEKTDRVVYRLPLSTLTR
ncbi:hypothetical protein IKG02_03620 [Candidatus Saccharibacteria bacterium]|nr:hypothetical protein [Candidatus Saccharibacteria bacterium]